MGGGLFTGGGGRKRGSGMSGYLLSNQVRRGESTQLLSAGLLLGGNLIA